MKARPILFSKEMAKAIIAGIKTQTRRVIKDSFNGCWTGANGSIQAGGHPCPNEPVMFYPGEKTINEHGEFEEVECENVEALFICSTMEKISKCPYGKIGDILYGRETIWTNTQDGSVIYTKPDPKDVKFWKATPSIHVPKKHARIWLQITDIKAEKLLDISDKDAIAEGLSFEDRPNGRVYFNPGVNNFSRLPSMAYLYLWDSINGENSHKINPWVWVVEFEDIGFEKAVMLLTQGQLEKIH
jgi:hypothetical protein